MKNIHERSSCHCKMYFTNCMENNCSKISETSKKFDPEIRIDWIVGFNPIRSFNVF